MKKLRARTVPLTRNGLSYTKTMLPNGDIVYRERYARRSTTIREEEQFQQWQRLKSGALFPEEIA